MINIFSLFDAIFIGKQLQKYIGDFNYSEIQMFSYFSCLLSLYEGNPISFWGYKFIKNDMGVPLSFEINDAILKLEQSKEFVIKNDSFFNVTNDGLAKLDIFTKFDLYNHRIKYLQASCDSLLAIPIGNFRSSIYEEPLVKLADKGEIRNLMDEDNVALYTLYDQFEILKMALKDKHSDLFVPAVTWLRFLEKKLY